jgi:DNA-binding response OmpR family regulator
VTGPGDRRRVLVVEDDPDAASVLADYLTQAGFAAHVAHDVDEALATARAHAPDVLITDLRLRGPRGGLDLVRALAGEPGAPPLIFAVSGYATREEREEASALGVEGIFSKPFDPDALVARLRARLEDPPRG